MSADARAPRLLRGERVSMARTAKMELLRALVSERLSAAAEEIFRIVEGTIVEYENEMSCSTWVVDSHRRLLDVTESHGEDVTPEQPAASVDVGVCWEEPTEDSPDMNDSPASDTDLEIRIDFEDDDVKQEYDPDTPLKIPEEKKPSESPVCFSSFSSKRMTVQHIKKHPEDNSSLYRCQYCARCFCRKSEFILHARTHKGAKPRKYRDCDERDHLPILRQRHAEEKPYQLPQSLPVPTAATRACSRCRFCGAVPVNSSSPCPVAAPANSSFPCAVVDSSAPCPVPCAPCPTAAPAAMKSFYQRHPLCPPSEPE
ncbi:Zinc finger protein 157 [Liparis tanakae]|uniref:Zinc finger protein 157 n=1 Tax=Liparis tanakae TaxID=230148 RepID=A0A4Z2FLA3_9TELE|nr:Zinc finger protein 157 [Liparis tanakae]